MILCTHKIELLVPKHLGAFGRRGKAEAIRSSSQIRIRNKIRQVYWKSVEADLFFCVELNGSVPDVTTVP